MIICCVVALGAVGLAGSVGAAQPGPIGLPAVQGTVKDLCTGKPITGFTAQAVDPAGNVVPAVQRNGKFTIASIDAPSFTLQVSAPGHQPVGEALEHAPGGQVTLPGGFVVEEGLTLSIGLMPDAPCARPRAVTLPPVLAMAVDEQTGARLVIDTTVSADPAAGCTDPNASMLNDHQRKISVWDGSNAPACVDFFLNCVAGGHYKQVPIHARPASPGDVAVQTTLLLGVPALTDAPPQIDAIVASDTAMQSGGAIALNATAHDPDGDPVTAAWTSSGALCSFTQPTALSSDIACSGAGAATVTLTVTEPAALSATQSFSIWVIAPSSA